ncbi:MAG: exonuclease domain-containing protein [Chloroflexi bacterium]|nr:exonuclease domain-containing protein [Chloroflexota bacterium]
MREAAPVFISLDLEATGPSTTTSEIIEFATVRFTLDGTLEEFSTLVRPKGDVPERIARLTGITPQELITAPIFPEIRARCAAAAGHGTLIGHSIEADLRRLEAVGLVLADGAVDTIDLAMLLLPELSSFSLEGVAEALGLLHGHVLHRALSDARLTRDVFLALFDRASSLPLSILSHLVDLLRLSDWPVRGVFELALKRQKPEQPPEPHTSLSPALVLAASRPMPNHVEALRPAATRTLLDPRAVAEVWSDDGPLARSVDGYEQRPQQVELSLRITEAFNQQTHLLAEAGTGTGKTLAYLLPSALWARHNGERVVISTNTVNLQDQILTKDVPDVEKTLQQDLHVQVLKGRGNYLCLLRWTELRARRAVGLPLTRIEARALSKMLLWLTRTHVGDVAELHLVGEEQLLWSQVAASQETCINDACTYKQRGQCFLFNARKRAETAHLIVVNHALLLSDLTAESRVLPEYRHLVIDEAHHLENQATASLSKSLSRRDLQNLLEELGLPETERGRGGSVVSQLRRQISGMSAGGAAVLQTLDRVSEAAQKVHYLSDSLFLNLGSLLTAEAAPSQTALQAPVPDLQLRITGAIRSTSLWRSVEEAAVSWQSAANELRQALDSVLEALERLGPAEQEETEQARVLLTLLSRRWTDIRLQVIGLVEDPDERSVYWLSLESQGDTLTMHSAPLRVSEMLRELLYEPRDTVVLTSATLSVAGSFDYVAERLGLDRKTPSLSIASPFNYREQVLLLLPRDLGEPTSARYTAELYQALIDFAAASDGRCLVLFTANAALRSAQRAIKPELERAGIAVLAQGVDGPRQQLVTALRHHRRTVLLGSASFWEGVDIAGEALSALAIVRLPFTVPSDPVFAARSEEFSRPFDEYAVPQAILRFKQGFGRLIRTARDRGVLLVLDSRLTTKYYGAKFLRSLPKCTTRTIDLREIGRETRDWLAPRLTGR